MLQDLPIKPGLYTDDTARDVGKLGFWKAADKVRFFSGLPAKLGGWTRGVDDPQFVGTARGSADWRTFRSEVFIAVGTHVKAYIWSGGRYYDVTPLDGYGTITDPFTTVSGEAAVTVYDLSHGRLAGDYVHFSGASAVGGITVDGEYVVATVVNSNTYTITHSSAASGDATGGGSVAYEYEIHVGTENSVAGLGWGAGTWGSSTWGTPRSVTDFLAMARVWQFETWGEDLIANPRQGGVYVWDSSAGVSQRLQVISAAPATAKGVLVSPEDRHLIALGAHDGVSDDPLLVRWCSQENYTDWEPTVLNTAGSKRLDTGNEILCAAKVRGEHLIFTDSALFSMSFVGPPDTFGFRTLGDNGNLVGPMAVHVFEGVAYWMGDQDFFMYDGVTKVIDCTITTTVFQDFNRVQRAKVYCGVNRDYREVWWLYPSAGSDECDRYVIYNMQDAAWTYGTLARTMLVGDSDVVNYVYGFGADGYMYTHEQGVDAYDEPMEAFIESGDIELDAGGNQFAHVSRMIPDFKTLTGSVDVTVTGRKYPQASETASSGAMEVTSSTAFISPRLRARQISIKISSDGLGDNWRSGTMRVDLLPHGRR